MTLGKMASDLPYVPSRGEAPPAGVRVSDCQLALHACSPATLHPCIHKALQPFSPAPLLPFYTIFKGFRAMRIRFFGLQCFASFEASGLGASVDDGPDAQLNLTTSLRCIICWALSAWARRRVLEARIIPERIEHRVEPEQRGSERARRESARVRDRE